MISLRLEVTPTVCFYNKPLEAGAVEFVTIGACVWCTNRSARSQNKADDKLAEGELLLQMHLSNEDIASKRENS